MTLYDKLCLRLRHLLEAMSRNVYFTGHLPSRFGALRLRISPGASLCYYRGLSSANLQDLYDFAENYVRPGQTVWDIGANMGVFTFAAAARAGVGGQVLAFEPDLWSVGLLNRSCAYNRGRAAEVNILPVAVSHAASLEWLNIPERCRAASHLELSGGAGKELVGRILERHLVPVVALDWVATHYNPPHIIKIDVDGGELRVLSGARTILQNSKPVMLVEVYERNADAVSAFLHELGYSLFDYTQGEKGKHPITRAVYNTLALPPGT